MPNERKGPGYPGRYPEQPREQMPQPVDATPEGGEPAASDTPTVTFADLGLSEALLQSISAVGYEEPTPIQRATISVLLDGRDVTAQAQTGSGKTAAFGLPIIEAVDTNLRKVQALILCPTRELAIQVAEAMHKYGRHKNVETLPIYGGQPYERQFRGLERAHIVVGTPGRVMDHMRRNTLRLDDIQFFVLDEADEMLDMGFIEDIEWILEQAPADKQIALFSATMPPRIADLAGRYQKDPAMIRVAGKEMTVPATRQSYVEVPRARKADALTRILDAEAPPLTMIFCRTKMGVDELGEQLLARGYQVETLHGDLSQVQRDRVMRRFRSGQADILIATDVAARGLDVPEVTHVINFDIPESAETYVHRIGRTGRAGRSGEAITLITPREVRWMRQVERTVKAKIEPRRLPSLADVAARRREALREQVEAAMKNEDGFAQYLETIEELGEEHNLSEVAAALMKLYADETGRGVSADLKEDDLAVLAPIERGRGERGMVRLVVSIGRTAQVRPQDLVGAIANEAGIPGRAIGSIDIMDTYSFVEIPAEMVPRVIDAISRSGVKNRAVTIEVAAPAQRPPQRGGRPGGFQNQGRPPYPPRPYQGGRGPRPAEGRDEGRPTRGGGGYAGRRPARPYPGDRPIRPKRDEG